MSSSVAIVVLGTLLFAAVTAPTLWASARLARRFCRGGWDRVTVTLFVWVLQAVLVLQLIGVARLYTWWGLCIGAAVSTVALLGFAQAVPAVDDGPEEPADADVAPSRRLQIVTLGVPLTIFAVGVVVAVFTPDSGYDSLQYHRSLVIGWFQEGSIWRIGAFENGFTYEGAYPSNGDLLGLWFLLPYGRDWLLQSVTIVYALGAAAALVSLAREVGLRSWRVVGFVAVVLALPQGLWGQVGHLHVDMAMLQGAAVLFWAGLRWLRHDDRLRWAVLAAFGAGLAVGGKVSAVATLAVFLASVVVVALRRRRWAVLPVVFVCGALPVVVWFVRTLALRGDALWPLGAARGAWAEEVPTLEDSWYQWLLRAPAEAVVLLGIGIVVALGAVTVLLVWSGRRTVRHMRAQHRVWWLLGVPVVGYAGYLAFPSVGSAPAQFLVSQRYALPSFVLVILAMFLTVFAADDADAARRWPRRIAVAVAVNGALGALVLLAIPLFRYPWWVWLAGVAIGFGVAWRSVGWHGTERLRRLRERLGTRNGMTVAGVAVVAVVALAAGVHAAVPFPSGTGHTEMQAVYRWLQTGDDGGPVTGKRIAFAGLLPAYLSGPDLSNDVYWLGRPTGEWGVAPWAETDRDAWLRALRATCTDFVVATDERYLPIYYWGRPYRELDWAISLVEEKKLQRVVGSPDDVVQVFAVTPDPPEDGCLSPEQRDAEILVPSG